MSSAIPSIHFDTSLLPVPERFARWAEAVPTYEVAPLGDGGAAAFSAEASAWFLGELVVTYGRLTPVSFARSAKKASLDGQDSLTFLLLTHGSWTGTIEERSLTVGPGQVAAFDLMRPVSADATENGYVSLGVSRRALQASAAAMPDLHGRVLDGTPGRLMADHFLSLVRHLPAVTAPDVAAVTKATLGVIAGGLASLPPESAVPARGSAVWHRARRYIDQNLASADLSPGRICREIAVSRATLNRAFAGSGGVANYILGRRLEAVHARLAHPDEHRSIGEIAHDFAFTSASHFSAAFRSRFGYSPRDVRVGAAVRGGGDAGSEHETETQRFRAWIWGFAST